MGRLVKHGCSSCRQNIYYLFWGELVPLCETEDPSSGHTTQGSLWSPVFNGRIDWSILLAKESPNILANCFWEVSASAWDWGPILGTHIDSHGGGFFRSILTGTGKRGPVPDSLAGHPQRRDPPPLAPASLPRHLSQSQPLTYFQKKRVNKWVLVWFCVHSCFKDIRM